jgi:membrane protein YdbS with pleckstrin-like domain
VGTGTNPMITAGVADRMGAMTADAPAPVRDPAWSLSRSAIGLWVTEGVIGALVWAVVVTAVLVFVPDDALPSPLRWALVAFAVLEAAVTIGIRPWVRYRVHRWEVTGEAVYTLTGWLTRTWTLVPISRIQTVDVTRGVLQQLFGLATVAVLTASSQGTVRVLHLEADVAQRVADDLARRAELVRDEAT